MKKAAILFLFLAGSLTPIIGQNFKDTDALQENKKLRKGVLKNGLTYYIYNTDVNKNTASYYIIQNVGSILENDQQKGLAHFLEHMAFNGTENFKGKGILNTLQKHGAVFGRNINAYTSFDETVYNFDNIPTNVPGLMDSCLLILNDWSHNLSLTNEEIDSERGVITEEWRTRQNAGMRIFEQIIPAYFNNSKYAERMPIGDMNIVKNFEYKALRDFYQDWYRTDLQAIAVIGDVNVDEVEQKIKLLFSKIPAVPNPKKRLEVVIPDRKEPVFKLALDKEIASSDITFMIRNIGKDDYKTFADLQKKTQIELTFSLINKRLRDLSLQDANPFIKAGINYGKFQKANNALSISIAPKPNKQAEAFSLVLNELIRTMKFGFSEGEIQRAIAETQSSYEEYVEKESEISHKNLIGMVKDNYLENKVFTDPKSEYEMVKSILQNTDTKALQGILNEVYKQESRVIMVTGVEGETNLTQESALAIVSKAENNTTLQPYKDEFIAKSLMTDVAIVAGKIVSENENKETGSTTFLLSNGVKVHYKFANKNKSDVQLIAESFGGSSLYHPKEMPSVANATTLADMSGLGIFSSTDLKKVLAGKNANSFVKIGTVTESVFGLANLKDIETMMQLVHLRFVKPRFDPAMFDLLKNNAQNSLKNKNLDIKSRYNDSISAAVYGKNNSKIRLFNQAYINDLSYDQMKKVYLERYSAISGFEFFIVGDVDPKVLKPLLEKYIAGIKGDTRKETYKDNTVAWQQNKIDKDVFIKMETSKSTVNILFQKDYSYNQKNRIMATMLGAILQLRYTESLREKEGGTYGASVDFSMSQRPKNKGTLSISFDCDANKVESLLPIVYQEIEKIKKGTFNKEDLEKTKKNYLKSREDSKDFNKYSMDLIYNYFINDYNMDDPATYENSVKSISENDLQKFAKAFLNKAKSYEVVLKPKVN
jgi:zinc protease